MSLLEVRDLNVCLPEDGTDILVARASSLRWKGGKPVALVGESGSAKSVTA